MKKQLILTMAILILGFMSTVVAQTAKPNPEKITPPTVHGPGFVDKNGDGFNDNAPDHDGDGIPNGVDPDFKKNSGMGSGFIDANGDGINDNAGKRGKGQGMGNGNRGGKGAGRGTCKNIPVKTTVNPQQK